MILVSGTGRSGTSLWMQVLGAAGHPVIGEAHPARYATLRSLNPRGFFESRLIHGVNFSTNPDPTTGAYLPAEESRTVAVKVLCAGLRRTEARYLDRVLLCTRGWRAWSASVERLHALDGGDPGGDPTLAWFVQQVGVLEDARLRGYPLRIQPYERVCADPEDEVREALAWIGGPADVGAAIACVAPARTQPGEAARVTPARAEALDALEAYLNGRDPGRNAGWEALLSWRSAMLAGTI